MALQKQYLDISFGAGGINQRLDSKVLELPHLAINDNTTMEKGGALALRPGYSIVPATHTTPIHDARRLGARDDKLVMIAEEPPYIAEYTDPTLKAYDAIDWVIKPTMKHARSNERILLSSTGYLPGQIDSVVFGDYLIVGCTLTIAGDTVSDPAGLRMFVFDKNTFDLIYERDISVDSAALSLYCKMKFAVLSGRLFILYTDNPPPNGGSHLNVREYTPSTNTLTAATVLVHIPGASPWFDVDVSGSYIYVIYIDATSNYPVTAMYDVSLTLINYNAASADGTRYTGSQSAVGIGHDTAGHIYIIYQTVNGIYYNTLEANLTSFGVGGQLVDVAYSPILYRATITQDHTTGAMLFFECSRTSVLHATVRVMIYNIAWGVGIGTYLAAAYWVRLLHEAKAGSYNNGTHGDYFVGLTGTDTIEGTNYTCHGFPSVREGVAAVPMPETNPIAQFQTRISWPDSLLTEAYRCDAVTSFNLVEAGRYWWVTSTKFNIAGKIQSALVLNDVDMRTTTLAKTNENKRRLGISASIPTEWDGSGINEIGFIQSPVIIDAHVIASGSTTGIVDGDYKYVVVYERRDAYGNLYRSRPSLPYTVTVTGVVEPYVQVDIRSYTGYRYGNDDVSATLVARVNKYRWRPILFRTVVGGTGNYYRVYPVWPDTELVTWYSESDSCRITDYISDAILITNELLYTTGGVLEEYASPPCDVMERHQNRMFAVNSNDGSIWWSQEFEENKGLAYYAGWYLVNPLTDIPTALISLNEQALVVFWPHRIGVIYGEGPNNLGQGGSYTTPQLLAGDVGAKDWRSVVKTQVGIFFFSSKGFFLLPFDLGVPQYIGAAVDDHRNGEIHSAVNIESRHHVRFGLTNTNAAFATVLLYDYLFGQWLRWPGVCTPTDTHYDSVQIKGAHCILHIEGISAQSALWDDETGAPGNYYDKSGAATYGGYWMFVQTPWIKLSGLQGYQRVWNATLLGESKAGSGQHTLYIYIYYNFGTTDYDLVTIPWATISAKKPYSFRIGIPKQRCEAIKFSIVLAPTVVTSPSYYCDRSATLTGLRLEYGILPGSMRLPHITT